MTINPLLKNIKIILIDSTVLHILKRRPWMIAFTFSGCIWLIILTTFL